MQGMPIESYTCSVDSFILLRKGTPITLELMEDLSSNEADKGSTVEMSVYIPVKSGDATLIKTGVYAEGEIRDARRAGIFGRPGRISVVALTVTAIDGQRISLDSAVEEKSGKDRYGLAWGGSLGIPVVGLILSLSNPLTALIGAPALGFGFFIKGKDARIPARTKIPALVRRDVLIEI